MVWYSKRLLIEITVQEICFPTASRTSHVTQLQALNKKLEIHPSVHCIDSLFSSSLRRWQSRRTREDVLQNWVSSLTLSPGIVFWTKRPASATGENNRPNGQISNSRPLKINCHAGIISSSSRHLKVYDMLLVAEWARSVLVSNCLRRHQESGAWPCMGRILGPTPLKTSTSCYQGP